MRIFTSSGDSAAMPISDTFIMARRRAGAVRKYTTIPFSGVS